MAKQTYWNDSMFLIKLPKAELKIYKQICLEIWGCIPADIQWARETKIYKLALNKLI